MGGMEIGDYQWDLGGSSGDWIYWTVEESEREIEACSFLELAYQIHDQETLDSVELWTAMGKNPTSLLIDEFVLPRESSQMMEPNEEKPSHHTVRFGSKELERAESF